MKKLKTYIKEGLFDSDIADDLTNDLHNYFEVTFEDRNRVEFLLFKNLPEGIQRVTSNGEDIITNKFIKLQPHSPLVIRFYVNSKFITFENVPKWQCMTKIDFSHFDGKYITSFEDMFHNSPLKEVDFGQAFKNSKIKTANKAFMKCEFETINLENVNFEHCETMIAMFRGSENLRQINFGNQKTPKLKVIAEMCLRCEKLNEINGFNTFDFSNLTHANCAFQTCRELKSIDFGNTFTGEYLKTCEKLFSSCFKLKEIKGLENFIGTNCTNYELMFDDCQKLKQINLHKFNPKTDSLYMRLMFFGCEHLETIDLSNFEMPDWFGEQNCDTIIEKTNPKLEIISPKSIKLLNIFKQAS